MRSIGPKVRDGAVGVRDDDCQCVGIATTVSDLAELML